MTDHLVAKEELRCLWDADPQRFVGRRIDVALYPMLKQAIPDRHLVIEEVVIESTFDEIASIFNLYLHPFGVSPFLTVFGGQIVVCVGDTEQSRGKVMLFDFDFGLFPLNSSVTTFCEQLVA